MDYIFGYRSLVSRYSRQHYSKILSEATVATVKGWCRSLCVSYPDEGATYAGALRDDVGLLNGVLIATDIGEAIADRERGYQFTRLNIDDLLIENLAVGEPSIGEQGFDGQGFGEQGRDSFGLSISQQDQIWIYETMQVDTATPGNPLPQSYVDTCMSGCLESQGVDGAIEFIQQTRGWDFVWLNDRHLDRTPRYPRYTPISSEHAGLIDSLLEQQGVLKFRQSSP
ncbi:MAG: hypothetical protein ACJAUP_002934 [Cellvibrionaceae bacterium]|jgi:hypothetical protein